MNRSELLDQVLDEMGDQHTSSVATRPTGLFARKISESPSVSERDSGHRNTVIQSNHRLPTGQRSVVQAICLLVMAFCTYGLFAFFQTTLIKCSDTTSFPVTSVSAHISPDVQPLVTSSDAAPPPVKYVTKSFRTSSPLIRFMQRLQIRVKRYCVE